IYVCGRQGKIWYFDDSPYATTKHVFLDLSAQTQGYSDSGVLAMAFHPQFGQAGSPNRGYVYVYYNYTPGPIVGSESSEPYYVTPSYDRLSRFTVPDGSDVADPNSELVLINQFDRDLWHNGCGMFFGPDGFLYFTNGDEGGVNDPYDQTQKIDSGLFSGVFRIDVNEDPTKSHPIRRQPQPGIPPPAGWPPTYSGNYYIPNDNPWQDPTGGTLEEFWALGFREPWRMTLDPATGTIWLGDVGQDQYEEIDIVRPGGNYQWSYMEGFIPGPRPKPSPLIGNDTPPIYAYPHAYGDGCVIGGYVYRGTKFANLLEGQYVYGDYDSNRVWSMNYSGSGTPVVSYLTTVPGKTASAGGISTFGEDNQGELYIATMGPSASIYKLALPGSPGYLTNISARAGVSGASQPLIAGFVVAGSGSKTVLLRGVGPALGKFSISDPVPTPELQLYAPSTALLAENAGWCNPSSNQAAVAGAESATGAFQLPAGSPDSALVETLGDGAYTIQVTGAGGSAGIGLGEIYDDSRPPAGSTNPAELVNLSARAITGPGAQVLTAGFVIAGSTPLTVLIRGVGPALSQYGVTGVLPDPQLQLFDSSGSVIGRDAGWGTSPDSAAIASTAINVGAFALPSGSEDSALLVTLAPGAYTAQVSGASGDAGEAMVEVYAVPY
ncbi:MAG: PQQ-dependent sugar dehydrogenase, partial [Opitutaceae bacterium]